MAARIRKASYYSTKISNRPGAGAKVLAALKQAQVDLLAFTGFPVSGGAQLDFVPADDAALRRAAQKAGLRISARKTVFLVQGDDRVGALTGILDRLAQARIGVVALDAAIAGKGRFGAIFWVKKKDVARASRLLGAR